MWNFFFMFFILFIFVYNVWIFFLVYGGFVFLLSVVCIIWCIMRLMYWLSGVVKFVKMGICKLKCLFLFLGDEYLNLFFFCIVIYFFKYRVCIGWILFVFIISCNLLDCFNLVVFCINFYILFWIGIKFLLVILFGLYLKIDKFLVVIL